MKKSNKLLVLALSLFLTGCSALDDLKVVISSLDSGVATKTDTVTVGLDGDFDLSKVPSYTGSPYVILNDNKANFTDDEKSVPYGFEYYSDLDDLGRCQGTLSLVGKETMPTEERGSIGMIKPTGWHTVKYDFVDGKYLYNRCHLQGYQLTGENANEKNLITGTRYLNIDGMLDFENQIADYVENTGNHVLYRVTPIFKDDELVARGVHMEAYSLEDNGEGLQFNVFAYNVQPGVDIDYATGESQESDIVL